MRGSADPLVHRAHRSHRTHTAAPCACCLVLQLSQWKYMRHQRQMFSSECDDVAVVPLAYEDMDRDPKTFQTKVCVPRIRATRRATSEALPDRATRRAEPTVAFRAETTALRACARQVLQAQLRKAAKSRGVARSSGLYALAADAAGVSSEDAELKKVHAEDIDKIATNAKEVEGVFAPGSFPSFDEVYWSEERLSQSELEDLVDEIAAATRLDDIAAAMRTSCLEAGA